MSGYAPNSAAPARPRRGARRLLLSVVLLVGLLVVADRLSALVAERVAATTLQKSQHLSVRPSVSIGGFPFLTQLVSARFDNVTVTVDGLSLGPAARPLRIESLVVHLRRVSVARNLSSVRAATARADAHISYADLSETLGAAISYDGPSGGGRVIATTSVRLAGRAYRGAISSGVRASSADGLSFTDLKLALQGKSVPALDSGLAAIFATPIPLRGLRFGVQVQDVDVTAGGLIIHLSGTNVAYRQQ